MAPTHMHMHFVSQNVYMSGCGPSMYATSALFPFTPLTATVTVKPANSTSTVNPLLPSPRRPGCALGGGDARGREAQTQCAPPPPPQDRAQRLEAIPTRRRRARLSRRTAGGACFRGGSPGPRRKARADMAPEPKSAEVNDPARAAAAPHVALRVSDGRWPLPSREGR